jgi:VanZ family protein
MTFLRSVAFGVGLLLGAVVGPGSPAAHAQRAAPAAADSVHTASDLPPTLSALRTQLFAPIGEPAGSPAPTDRWWAQDKAQHVAFSGLWTLSTQYVLVQKAGWGERSALPVAAGTAAAVGGLKEVYDATRPQRDASGKDLVANAVGIGLAVGLILW